ncbi:MAG TPA: DUF294 nucleotidyltransferase-like domain-containing protein [Polyangiaceae bacterium]|nr:DUF294 nucleotidyltransferase-like domain-containing protein [Polyangiaceae bacterium]
MFLHNRRAALICDLGLTARSFPRAPSSATLPCVRDIRFVEELEQRCNADWPAIRAARRQTEELVGRVGAALAPLHTAETSIIATGSVGRAEVTQGSDFDWYLLIDGPSDPDHFRLAQRIEEELVNLGIKKPAAAGPFGAMVISHDLVHYIAGSRDTNENLTRRILLLLESRAISNPLLRERVIRNVLARYVISDPPVPSRSGRRTKVPHFLLNDVVRYWRTIASDFASKMWERQLKGWGIRNVKLRFSRKLLFIGGLLGCFAADLSPSDEINEAPTEQEYLMLLADLIFQQTRLSPLDQLARVLCRHEPELGSRMLGAYDAFLAALDDPSRRSALEKVDFEDANQSAEFERLRKASQIFRKAVNELFFDRDETLKRLVRDFGFF